MSQFDKILFGDSPVTFKGRLQHHFNPLHVYCRLRDWGISSRLASRFSSFYERFYRVCAGRSCKDR